MFRIEKLKDREHQSIWGTIICIIHESSCCTTLISSQELHRQPNAIQKKIIKMKKNINLFHCTRSSTQIRCLEPHPVKSYSNLIQCKSNLNQIKLRWYQNQIKIKSNKTSIKSKSKQIKLKSNLIKLNQIKLRSYQNQIKLQLNQNQNQIKLN